ncbi:hypothetical protein G7B40_001490 [Aetokthonos hydrillicola Thurmond2011]|uniref:Uncharacterized protein n=2 Tax=Aetokthonos TaxID=1550243 RepID=A0AAP5I3T7_9CYAN|nr:hypothetical protein [Aetokthonos hydrillicola]MBW4591078.1 hypothetical protein [Aetokthonos hydrillicola CCALA 1050]MDR9893259.1 hypothetical protein [Aetokthonos hydrillicola Thurmond2011]
MESSLRFVNRLSIYGFWFLTAVAIANLSRLLPGAGILYLLLLLAVPGYLLLVPSQNEQGTATRRLTGLALALSFLSYWDWLVTIVTLPIHIFSWILPAWQIALLVIVCSILLLVIVGLLS